MISALFPNRRPSGVRGHQAPFRELVFVCLLFQAQGCAQYLPYCPPDVGPGYGCLEEDLCLCNPATGVLPPPDCMLMLQAGRWQPVEPLAPVVNKQPSSSGNEQRLAQAQPQPPSSPAPDAVPYRPAPPRAPLRILDEPQPVPAETDRLASADAIPQAIADALAVEITDASTVEITDANSDEEPASVAPAPVLAQAAPRTNLIEPMDEEELELPPAPRPAPLKIARITRKATPDEEPPPAPAVPESAGVAPLDELALPPAPRPAPLNVSRSGSPAPRPGSPYAELVQAAEYRNGRER